MQQGNWGAPPQGGPPQQPGYPQAQGGWGAPPGAPQQQGYAPPQPGYGPPPQQPGYGAPPGYPQQGYGPGPAGSRPVGTCRSPGIVILLFLVTFGIYPLIWYYSTFNELHRYRGQGWSGGMYLLFQFLFPFPLVAMPWLIPAYVGRMYAEDNRQRPIDGNSGWWLFVPFAGVFIWILKVQGALNDFWQSKGAPPA
jgi:hypothetical protein